MLVVGVLVFALQSVARQQNMHAHRIGHGQVCEDLARSGLTVLSTRFRETFRRSGKILPLLAALGNTRLGFFVASRPEQITQRFSSLGQNSDAIFRSLLGPDYRFPLDQMLERVPGAQVELTISIIGRPLYVNSGVEDPVEKTCDLTLTAKATYLDVTRRVSTGFVIKVVNPAPPLAAKFTLFTPEAIANWNTVENDSVGRLTGAGRPAILFNTPLEDQEDALDDLSLVRNKADAPTVKAAMTNRGHVFLGSRGAPLVLNLTAGLDGFGEFFHLHNTTSPVAGQLWTTLYTPPPFFNGFSHTTGIGRDKRYENAEWNQFPNLTRIFYGFDTTLAGDPNLGDTLTDGGKSSALHLYGTAEMPSRTVVWGNVSQAVCKVSAIGMITQNKLDPSLEFRARTKQFQNVPYLRYCPSREFYVADLGREESGQKPAYLVDIRRDFPPGPTPVWAFGMDPNVYTHRAMFSSDYVDAAAEYERRGYAAQMSRVERYPFNEMADAMLYPNYFPPSSLPPGTAPTVLDLPYTGYHDVQHVELGYSDSLHRSLGQARYFSGDLGAFFAKLADAPSPAETILRARTMREFASQSEFLAACEWPPGSKHLEIWDCVSILDGGLDLDGYTCRGVGQVVVKGNITSSGLVARALPDGIKSLITIATLEGDLALAGGQEHHAFWLAPRGTLTVSGTRDAMVVGGLAVNRLVPENLGPGLVVNFTSQADPTRSDDARHGRYVDYYLVGMGQLPVSVERLP